MFHKVAVQMQKAVVTFITTLRNGIESVDCVIKASARSLKVVVTVTTTFESGSYWTQLSIHINAPMCIGLIV